MTNEEVAKLIKDNIYAVIATANADGQPWNSPVYVVYDDTLNFYWASGLTSQHSHNIADNDHAFLVIFDPGVGWGEGRGVYILASASEVKDEGEIKKACALRAAREPKASQQAPDFMGDAPRRIYKATPQQVWVNQDATKKGYFVDTRREIPLDDLAKALITI